MDPIIDWLMEGDPSIRWQTMRDLMNMPEDEWKKEQRRTQQEGWGAQLLALQAPNGIWDGGLYSPKWTSTTYTLLTLCSIGIPTNNAAVGKGARLLLDKMLGETCNEPFQKKLVSLDRCIAGMILQISAYFEIKDARINAIIDNLLSEQMPDGGWNCRRLRYPKTHHSSFHTTFNVLEGLRTYMECGDTARFNNILAAEGRALDFMLQHHLYRSDQTGLVINPNFTMLSFPTRWYYDILRGLEYFARAGAPCDSRLQDAIDLLNSKRRKDGCWPVQHKHPGQVFFDMEKTGEASRWNTLRALRVLRWWG